VLPVANKEHIGRLKDGIDGWNDWRSRSTATPDLGFAKLQGAKLIGANLSSASLCYASLVGVDLSGADLSGVNLGGADLSNANLSYANLRVANLTEANLLGTELNRAVLHETVLGNIDLSSASGLETCRHEGPSIIDHRTLKASGSLPLRFLQGVGLPNELIDYLPSQSIQYYSCFISYSAIDDDFAKRIHADLQNSGVRCWFAPHDLPIGGKILDEIDAAIRLRDKVLLVLSGHSIRSDWVEDEVKTAFEEERRRGQTVLFPVRIDDSIMETKEAWAAKLRADRNIGDFRPWRNHDEYQQVFNRVLRDLTAPTKKAE
jgi:uncharacterized protein YjbI with pentapeptide repeats